MLHYSDCVRTYIQHIRAELPAQSVPGDDRSNSHKRVQGVYCCGGQKELFRENVNFWLNKNNKKVEEIVIEKETLLVSTAD